MTTLAVIEALGAGSVFADIAHARFVRPDVREALDAWGAGDVPFTGDFLRAVLSNDLKGAMAHADHFNLITLPAIVAYMIDRLPIDCQGSPEAYLRWQRAHLPEDRSNGQG